MTTSAPPGTPYHRMARTERHRWWRPLVGTILVLAGFFTISCVVVGATLAVGELTDRPTGAYDMPTFGATADLALVLISIAAALPLVLLTARWVQARPAGTVSSVLGRLRWRWLGVCALVALPTVLLLLGGGLGLLELTGGADGMESSGDGWPGWSGFVGSVAVLLLVVPLQAAAEEYVCRGWLLQAVGAFFRGPWVAIGVQAVVFAAAHGWGTRWGFADLVVMATLTGWLTVRTGGLEAAVALHVVNNLVAFIGAAALGELASEETAADAPWEIFVVSVLVHTAYVVVVLWVARRRRVVTVAPERPAPAAPPLTSPWPTAPPQTSRWPTGQPPAHPWPAAPPAHPWPTGQPPTGPTPTGPTPGPDVPVG